MAARFGVWAVMAALALAPGLASADAQGDWLAARAAAFKAFKPGPTQAWDAPEAPQMALIPAGEVMAGPAPGTKDLRGNERPQAKVRFDKPLWVARYPVTVGEFAAFEAATHHDAGNQCWTFEDEDGHIRQGRNWTNPGFRQAPDHPVLCVSIAEVDAYIAWLKAKTGLSYRLLTEGEYEYANRAGSKDDFWWGEEVGANHANCDGCGSLWDNRRTSPVGSFKPNAFGLYDTAGDTWVWTSDCFVDAKTPLLPGGGCAEHAIRGGAWHGGPSGLRAFSRFHHTPDTHSATLGFRLAREP